MTTIANPIQRKPAGQFKSLGAVLALTVMSATFAASYGVFAADDKPIAGEAAPVAVNLAGRWTGHQYRFMSKRVDIGGAPPKPNSLTFDIVACGEAWCGIAVSAEATCGAVALKMARDPKSGRGNAFSGKLELAKGSAPYVIEAWYSAPNLKAGEGSDNPHLHFVGDTGGELLMMRRSFPFQAEMARVGEPVCTLEKATS